MNSNFITSLIKEDLEKEECREIVTRFPPEPNGHLHIGNAYAINISYSVAKTFNGQFNLRLDDTNPHKEDIKYVESIIEDMTWLGFECTNRVFYGSDYSQQLYEYAIYLINKGLAYVCDLKADEIRAYRGTLTTKGMNSPYRNRTIEENLALFTKMRDGHYEAGEKVLRAKIDMDSPNINLRDPIIYRISYLSHYRTKNDWCIYPMYDYAHPIQDYLEGITHSLCSIEFKDHKPLYEWVLNELDLEKPLPKQFEFGRMSLTGVVTSKRHLKSLVENNKVEGWDDPRLPTIKGLRRRGYTKDAIINFLNEIGVGRSTSLVSSEMLEHELRQDLKSKVPAVMAVIDPLKVVITNLPEDYLEYVEAKNNPENEKLGSRKIAFNKNIYIERDDFCENPPIGYKRLVLGEEVRLKDAYFIRCHEMVKDINGEIIELRCQYDHLTKSGSGFKDRKPKGTIHWVSASVCAPCEFRLFEDLFTESPTADHLFDKLNKQSLVVKNGYIESMALELGSHVQLIRHGYFAKDEPLSSNEKWVYNRSVSLKSSYKAK